MPTSAEILAAAVRDLLTVRGPMGVDDILAELAPAGVDLGPEAEDILLGVLDGDDEPFDVLTDDRWAWLPALLDGRVVTHRLSGPEIAHDMLLWGPDLSPLSVLVGHAAYRRLSDGSPIADVSPLFDEEELAERGIPGDVLDELGALLLPVGRLAALGLTAGDLIGVRFGADGLDLVAVADTAASTAGAALAALVDGNSGEPVMLDCAAWTVCTGDDEVFRSPAAPLGEQLAEAGLACSQDWIAKADFDFGAWRSVKRTELMKMRHDLDGTEAAAVIALTGLHEDLYRVVEAAASGADMADIPMPDIPDGDQLAVLVGLELLAEPAVAAAVLAETHSADDPIGAAALGLLAESLEPAASRRSRPALRWLRGVAQERSGEVELAEATFLAAETMDPSWPPTLLSLARYAGDRGDAERGLSLLRRAGAPPDDDMVVLFESFRSTPRPKLGRNHPCWCGSGRKYTVCHLNREQLPLEQRAAWLYQKASYDLPDGPFTPDLLDAARERTRYFDAPDALEWAFDEGLAADVVLFEGGAFEHFLDTRGVLLPEDERLLAEQWLLVERSVYEVAAVRRGEGLTMRDLRTGDVHEVRERAASTQVEAGELYCARVVPAGDTMQIFGGLQRVTLRERDDLIALLDDEPDPLELVALLSRQFAPPVLHNTEGEPLTMCEAILRTGDPAALQTALDGSYHREESEPGEPLLWLEFLATDGAPTVRAQLELSGEQVRVVANSEARADRVLAALRALDPSLEVLSETREPADLTAGGAGPGPELDPAANPELAAHLAEMVGQFETRWLDESIPALGGFTPRQCADDPTRRPDLIRLLDSFPETGQPGAMSPARLRAALDLD